MKLLYPLAATGLITASSLWSMNRAPHSVAPTAASSSWNVILAEIPGTSPLSQEIRKLQESVERDPSDLVALERLGWTFVQKARAEHDPGAYSLAEQCALALDQQDSESRAAKLLRGHVLQSLHRFQEAEALARQLTAEPSGPAEYGLLGDALLDQGKIASAAEAYQEMMNLRPDLHSYSRAARIRYLLGDVAGALEFACLASDAAHPRAAHEYAWALTLRATHELRWGMNDEAEHSLARALDRDPKSPGALRLRAQILAMREAWDEAIVDLRKAAQCDPHPETLWALAELLQCAGDSRAAAEVRHQLSRQGASHDPRSFSVYLASTGGDATQAVALARQELEDRQDPFTWEALAVALLADGQVKEARHAMQQALRHGTRDASLWYHAALVEIAANEHRAARQYANAAKDLDHLLMPSQRRRLHTAFPDRP